MRILKAIARGGALPLKKKAVNHHDGDQNTR
jgi:hypothetical protein